MALRFSRPFSTQSSPAELRPVVGGCEEIRVAGDEAELSAEVLGGTNEEDLHPGDTAKRVFDRILNVCRLMLEKRWSVYFDVFFLKEGTKAS